MRLSQRQNLSPVVYCKILEVLAACAPVLAQKAITFKFLVQMMEFLYLCCPAKGQCPGEGWPLRKLVASLRFIASVNLCRQSITLILGPGGQARWTDPGMQS